jgi:hypothetical protein
MGAFPVVLLRCLNHDLRQYPESREAFWPGATPRQVAASQLRKSFSKKFEEDNTSAADDACLAKFFEVNEHCKNWKLDVEHMQTWDEELWGEFKRSIHDFLHPGGLPLVGHFGSLLADARVGPGASIGALGGDFYTKLFASPLTSTRRVLYDEYRRWTRNYPEWCIAEAIRCMHFGETRLVKGNSLSFVPKYTHISRSICTEPSLNMFYQLGLGQVLERRLRSYFRIDIRDQQFHNRELARKGSLGLGFSTLDLESASDSISLGLCKELFPKWFNDLLGMLRSPTSKIRGREHELHMVSTMGNGFTFPLQTAIFSCMVEAAARWKYGHGYSLNKNTRSRSPWSDFNEHGEFGVFGDDIIPPEDLTPCVMKLLEMAGFRVNTSKSYQEGPFKESCGADYYVGINVRGVYIKSLETQQDFYSAINQLNLFTCRTGIPLTTTVRWLLSRVAWNPVPRWEDDSAGIKVPLSMVRNFRRDRNTGSIKYYAYVPIARRLRIEENWVRVPKGSKQRIFNPSGLHIAKLLGSVNSHAITVRHDRVRYKRKLRVAPNWDAAPTAHPLAGWFCWRRWENAVYLNI